MWKQSMWLAWKDYKFQWGAVIGTLLATVLLGMLTSQAFYSFGDSIIRFNPVAFYVNDSIVPFNHFLIDILIVGLTPAFGAVYMSKPYLSFRAMSEEPIRKRMAFYRTLPIPVEVLVRSKMLMALINLIIMSAAFYVTLYLFLPVSTRAEFAYDFLMVALLWFGYTLALLGFNPFIETAKSKMLIFGPFVFMFLVIIAFILVYAFTDRGMVEWSFYWINRWGWGAVIASWVVGLLGSYIWKKVLQSRFTKDYV